MKPVTLLCVAAIAGLLGTPGHAPAQGSFHRMGLSGKSIYDLALYGGKLYAATDDGIYTHAAGTADTVWKAVGLQGKRVRAVYPHDFGPISYAVTAGIERILGDKDSTLIYCSQASDSAWAPADTGMDRSSLSRITSISGFPSMAVCGETFAGGEGRVYRRVPGGIWELVFDIGIGALNVVETELVGKTAWAGGETAIFAPFIAHSSDLGGSWHKAFPDLQGDNACNSLVFDSLTIYAGMEGAVLRSVDGGHRWEATGLSGTPYYMYGLAIDPFTRVIFAAGSTNTNSFGLFTSPLDAPLWTSIVPPESFAGAQCALIVPTVIPEQNDLLLGTLGDGVVRYVAPLTHADDPQAPAAFFLHQNYPNPFNSGTVIGFACRKTGEVKLIVFDLLGREVAVLVEGHASAGQHTIAFDAAGLSSGVYIYRLTNGSEVRQRTMVVLR